MAELVRKTILKFQDPVTGLYRSLIGEFKNHAWLRDNVYTVQAVWALSLAYRKTSDLDEDKAKAYEYKHSAILTMRSLLTVRNYFKCQHTTALFVGVPNY